MSVLSSAKKIITTHKVLSVIAALAVIGGGYLYHQHTTANASTTKYVIGSVTKGTIISTVTGSGQVSATDQVDIKPKVSGDIYAIKAVDGQKVKAGDIILQLNATDALKALRDAQANLANSQLSLQKLEQPVDQLTLLQAEDSLTEAQNSKSDAEDSLTKSYDDAYNTISTVYLNLPNVMQGLQSVLYGTEVGTAGQDNMSAYTDLIKNVDLDAPRYQDDTAAKYAAARTAYDTAFATFKTTSRTSDTDTIVNFLNQSYDTTKLISDAVQSASNFLDYFHDSATVHQVRIPTQLAGHQADIETYTGNINSDLSSLLNSINTIKNDKDAIASADRTIAERQASLDKTTSGPDDLDLATQKLTVEQRQNAVVDAETTLAEYTVRAPFDGTITKVDVKKYDTVGSGTAVATLITNQQVAQITLNEVDAAKVKVGQKVNLTFDAIDGLQITGEVAEVDDVGTVSQGVVSYTVKISFDTQDDRIKPGMTVNASIVTDVQANVLMVPNSAIKTQGSTSYVEELPGQTSANAAGVTSDVAPTRQIVTTGAADDTDTEITSGLNEGDLIITRTTTSGGTATPAAAAPSLFGGAGGARGGAAAGGGNFRARIGG